MFEIYPVMTAMWIVLCNDRAVKDVHGQTIVFYREKDAQDYIDDYHNNNSGED